MDKQPTSSNTAVPQAIETERVVLARALSGKEYALELLSRGSEDLFWNHRNKFIYIAIRDIVAQGGTPDILTVNDRLKESGTVKMSDLSELVVASFDSHASVTQLVSILEKVATEREVLHLLHEAQQGIAAHKEDVLSSLTNNLLRVSNGFTKKTLFTARELAGEYFETLGSRQQNGGVAGVPFGYSDLDRATAGAKPGQLIIVAGRTSQGKSAFSENVITNMLKRSVKVYFASAETGREEIMDRMVGRLSGLGHNALMSGVGENEQKAESVNKALEKVYEFPLYLQDNPNITSDQIRYRHHHRHRERPRYNSRAHRRDTPRRCAALPLPANSHCQFSGRH